MSIFKETLKDFVCTQLRIREAIIEQGNNPSKYNHRFGNPRSNINVNGNNKKIKIDAGAFYTNTVHKQCIIRMTSGVDVTDKKILEFGEDAGNELAKSYILEGGVLDKNQKQRSGFVKNKGTYGAKSTRSNAADGFGIVPMPGIIDAEIRTKTAYGSLREAKINFVCHNRRQLEVLELLYMRPGMPILLEWGWSPFINNKGKITNDTPNISNDFFDGSKTIDTLNDDIRNKIEESAGNYDGFIGFCKNFEIASRSDGGYDCTTELIAMGEALESLKSRKDGDKISREGDEDLEVDSLEFLLESFKELGDYIGTAPVRESYDPDDFLNSEDKGKEYDDGNADFLILSQFINKLQKRNDWMKAFNVGLNKSTGVVEGLNKVDTNVDNDEYAYNLRRELDKLRNGNKGAFNNFFLFRGEIIKYEKTLFSNPDNTENDLKYKAADTYIRWDMLCLMMNLFVFPERKINQEPLINLVYTQRLEDKEVNGKMTYKKEYLEFAPYKFPTDSTKKEENKYKVIKNPKTGFFSKYKNIKEVNVENLLNASFNPNVCLLPNQIATNLKGVGPNYNQYIGLIHLNVDHLKKVYMDMAYNGDEVNKDFGLFDYIKKIWDDVNTACCGRHEFTLQTELENPNNIRIIDLQVNGEALKLLERENLFEFKIQSNKSIVRDYNFNTTIPSSFSATIAIAAQAPTSIDDLDQVTFANFNKGIKSRFTVTEETQPDFEAIDEYKKQNKKTYDKLFERYKEQIIQLAYYKVLIEHGKYNNNNGIRNNIDDFNVVLSLSKSIENTLNQLLRRNPKTGMPYRQIPKSRAAIVPLKFNAKIDGMGGMVIGNVFVVEKNKLPKGYQADNIAFVIMGESQKITTGQDWTTDFSGQMILTNDDSRDEFDKSEGPAEPILIDLTAVQDNTRVVQNIIIPEILDPLGTELEDDDVLPFIEQNPPSGDDKFIRNDGSGASLLGDGFIYEGEVTNIELGPEIAMSQAIQQAYSQLFSRTSFSGDEELFKDYVFDAQPYVKIIEQTVLFNTAVVRFKFQKEEL